MANIKQQKKRVLTNEKARLRNVSYKSKLRTAMKAVRVAVAAGDAEAERSAAAAVGAGGTLLGWGLYFVITSIVCLVLIGKAKRELADESKSNKKPFIVTIVVGAIASNPFYILGGIFGLIAEGQQGQQQAE